MSSLTKDKGLLGAIFLMATSAIGPGFITQTTQFTVQLGAAFAFAILVSVLIDVALQLNVWRVIGFVMIAMTGYVAVISQPPVGLALRNAVRPDQVDFLSITTLIGGTVGGYITYAGAHRLLDAGVHGTARVADISRASVIGVIMTGVMRVLLFMAVLGVVAAGVQLDPANPAASAFSAAAGEVGLRIFGLVLWAAAITSVIGASYTSGSFLVGRGAHLDRRRNVAVIAFILGVARATGADLRLISPAAAGTVRGCGRSSPGSLLRSTWYRQISRVDPFFSAVQNEDNVIG